MTSKQRSPDKAGQEFSQAFHHAIDLHRRGKLREAEHLYHQILEREPRHAGALHLLGVVRIQQGRGDEAVNLIRSALQEKPDSFDAICNLSIAFAHLRRYEEAVAMYDRALAIEPAHARTLVNRANALAALNRWAEAAQGYEQALAVQPDNVDALNNHGTALFRLGRGEQALVSYGKALAIAPRSVELLNNHGNVLAAINRPLNALGSYEQALAIEPRNAAVLNNRALALRALRRYAEALADCDKALAVNKDYASALNTRALALHDLGRVEEAIASYERALALKPDYAEALNNRGNALAALKRYDAAVASYDRALALVPSYLEAQSNRALALHSLRRNAEALLDCDRTLAAKRDYAPALVNRGLVLQALGRANEALASYDQALAIRAPDAETLNNRGNVLSTLNRFDEAIGSYESALAIAPDHPHALSSLANCRLAVCDWDAAAAMSGALHERVHSASASIQPFTALAFGCSASEQLAYARNYIRHEVLRGVEPLPRRFRRRGRKIRVAYVSGDFRRHAVGFLIARLIELHDRSRFEVVAVSFGPDDASNTRSRLVDAFDEFHDVRLRSDREAAELIAGLDPDIAVDLCGHTRGSRPGILAYRPAPVQVAYLGYAGTSGADFIDYVVGDAVALPFDQQPFYTETIVHLPECFQVNDSTKLISVNVPTRREAGLPDTGLVFCCFNQSFKITAPVFDVWMRLLRSVDDSVLWLSQVNGAAQLNLRRHAQSRGVDPARLIFAPRLERLEDHLARHRLADLFLDTLPYNAHTTASDALWSGLPVITCAGTTFAARVGASLLNAVGLPELVTSDLQEYEAEVIRLATDSSLLLSLRRKLEQNRLTCPLFDTDRFRRHLEAAYTTMAERCRRGAVPTPFAVERN